MKKKNSFSKAVMDLMGLQGNEENTALTTDEAFSEAAADQDNADMEEGRGLEPRREAEFNSEKKKFLHNVKTFAASNSIPIKEGNLITVISRSMVITGEITSSDDIEIYGEVKGSIKTQGDIKSTGKIVGNLSGNNFILNGGTVQGNIIAQGSLVIGLNTIVTGDIIAGSIKLNGKVKGNLIIAEMSEFLEDAQLTGDLKTHTIAMSQGAKLNGNVSVALDTSQDEEDISPIEEILTLINEDVKGNDDE